MRCVRHLNAVDAKKAWLGSSIGRCRRDSLRAAMLENNPPLKKLCSVDNGTMIVFYFERGTATIDSLTEDPKVIAL